MFNEIRSHAFATRGTETTAHLQPKSKKEQQSWFTASFYIKKTMKEHKHKNKNRKAVDGAIILFASRTRVANARERDGEKLKMVQEK